jgi:hypothetical protein
MWTFAGTIACRGGSSVTNKLRLSSAEAAGMSSRGELMRGNAAPFARAALFAIGPQRAAQINVAEASCSALRRRRDSSKESADNIRNLLPFGY